MPYILSLAVGVIVGILYALLGVRSPAPPIIALVGLLGIVIGEEGTALVKARLAARTAVRSHVEARRK